MPTHDACPSGPQMGALGSGGGEGGGNDEETDLQIGRATVSLSLSFSLQRHLFLSSPPIIPRRSEQQVCVSHALALIRPLTWQTYVSESVCVLISLKTLAFAPE